MARGKDWKSKARKLKLKVEKLKDQLVAGMSVPAPKMAKPVVDIQCFPHRFVIIDIDQNDFTCGTVDGNIVCDRRADVPCADDRDF